jgi:very-short-patch-repair endonuclease
VSDLHDKGWTKKAPPLQGRGLGWGLSNERLAELHGYARENRNAPTQPEIVLWSRLSRSQLGGYKFRRQAVIGPFIVDFLCPKKALIVEVDGHTHLDPGADASRDRKLGELGFRVLRVTNHDVTSNLEGVLLRILQVLESAPDRWNMPHPNPSPEGEGLSSADTEAGVP